MKKQISVRWFLICGAFFLLMFPSVYVASIPPAPQTLNLSSATYDVAENAGKVTLTLQRASTDVNRNASVDLTTSAGTATAGLDYTETTLTVNFAKNETSATVDVPILDDVYVEGNETINVTLSNAGGSGASLTDPSTAVITITEDDVAPICGNSFKDIGEGCDDGNLVSGDGCTATCVTEVCGDSVVNNNGAEQCDDGNVANGDCCDSNCKFEAADSPCNDGNACSATDKCDGAGLCTGSGSTCGDNVLDGACGEQCDDNNIISGDGCSSTCQTEYCGDGSVNNVTEQCDDSNVANGDGCSSTCQTEVCGDGAVNNNGTEQCDDSNLASGDGCSSTCQTEVCGDGAVNNNGLEGCDDSNLIDGDGCDSTCQIEGCGDGVVNNSGLEECDDSNVLNGDGCSATCKTEVCGDNVVNNSGLEECDDGNTDDGDGCSSICKNEVAPDTSVSDTSTDDTTDAPATGTSESTGGAGGCNLVRS